MKKIFTLLAVAVFSAGVAQEEQEKKEEKKINSVGLNFGAGNIVAFGAFYEMYKKNEKGTYNGLSIELNSIATDVNIGNQDFTGTGFEIRSGTKTFFEKEKISGFFTKSSISYGSIKFDETIAINQYKGTYSYFSFFAPEIGYDFLIAKKIRTSLTAGTQWQIEVKGKADVDNQDFNNWIFKAGLRLSYDF